MKLSSLSNINTEQKPRIRSYSDLRGRNSSNVNFTGAEALFDGMIKFWQFIDNNGRAMQFTAEDMFGTNLPRSYKGLTAGKKYTGKYNWTAFMQEFIREFLTGPTMTFFPMLVLGLTKSHFGPSSNATIENINNLSYLMDGVKEGTSKEVRQNFFEKVSKDLLENTLNNPNDNRENIEADTKKLCEALENYFNAFEDMTNSKKTLGLFTKKQQKAKFKEQENALTDLYTNIIKRNKADYSGTNFQTVKYSIGNGAEKTGTADFKSYMESAASYIFDYTKRNTTKDNIVDTAASAIQSFKNSLTGRRLFTMFNMIVITGLLMKEIPHIYTKASGKINPNASGIYDEAKKRGNKQQQNTVNTEVKDVK